MKNMRIKIITLTSVIAILSGCAGMNGHFGCNAKANTSCTPVSQVNARANAGDFDYQRSNGGRIGLPTRSKTFSYLSQNAGYKGVTPMPGEPVRTEGRIQRIWIAPYQDLANNYHEPSYVYTVLENPHWIGVPAKAIKTAQWQEDD